MKEKLPITKSSQCRSLGILLHIPLSSPILVTSPQDDNSSPLPRLPSLLCSSCNTQSFLEQLATLSLLPSLGSGL